MQTKPQIPVNEIGTRHAALGALLCVSIALLGYWLLQTILSALQPFSPLGIVAVVMLIIVIAGGLGVALGLIIRVTDTLHKKRKSQ
ncbi:MAG TPA: hypothetical protein VII11_00135 [Bacteroidota bacterium]